MLKFFAWIGANQGSVATTLAVLSEVSAAAWNIRLHQPVDLAALGGGLAAILTASAALLAGPPAAKALMANQQRKLALMEKTDGK